MKDSHWRLIKSSAICFILFLLWSFSLLNFAMRSRQLGPVNSVVSQWTNRWALADGLENSMKSYLQWGPNFKPCTKIFQLVLVAFGNGFRFRFLFFLKTNNENVFDNLLPFSDFIFCFTKMFLKFEQKLKTLK